MPTLSRPRNPTGRLAASHPGLVKLGRFGWLTKGIVYVLAGGLALLIVTRSFGWTGPRSAGEEASPTGAIKEVSRTAGGPVLLWALAIGLFIYAAWRVLTALLPGSTDAKGWVTRAGYLVSAVLYATFGITAVALARAPGKSTNGNRRITELTSHVMGNTVGRWLIGLAGLIAIGAGLYRANKGVHIDVDDELDLSDMSPDRLRWTRWLGAIGEIGRGVAIALIGFFLVRSAWTYNAAEATGLDGALRRLVVEWWGVVIVAVIGVGFIAYGVFCLTTFTRRRLQAP
jgi:hypothetical protein